MSNPKTRRAQTIIKPDRDRRFVTEDNPFEAMMSRFDDAARRLNLEPGLYKVLRSPEKQIIVSVPVQMDRWSSFRHFCLRYAGVILWA